MPSPVLDPSPTAAAPQRDECYYHEEFLRQYGVPVRDEGQVYRQLPVPWPPVEVMRQIAANAAALADALLFLPEQPPSTADDRAHAHAFRGVILGRVSSLALLLNPVGCPLDMELPSVEWCDWGTRVQLHYIDLRCAFKQLVRALGHATWYEKKPQIDPDNELDLCRPAGEWIAKLQRAAVVLRDEPPPLVPQPLGASLYGLPILWSFPSDTGAYEPPVGLGQEVWAAAAPAEPLLSERKRQILIALCRLHAARPDGLVRTAAVVAAVDPASSRASFKNYMRYFVDIGYATSDRGCKGGYQPTPKGLARAEALRRGE
jgi:hypothetical protein